MSTRQGLGRVRLTEYGEEQREKILKDLDELADTIDDTQWQIDNNDTLLRALKVEQKELNAKLAVLTREEITESEACRLDPRQLALTLPFSKV